MGTGFTDSFVRSAKCREGVSVTEFRDTDLRGLELRVTKAGKKSWRLHYTRRSDGRRRAIKLGVYPGLSLKEARAKAKGLQSSIESEEQRADPASERTARRQASTFAQLAEDWLELHARPNKCAGGVKDDVSMLQRHILPSIGGMRISSITKRDIIRLLDQVTAKADARRRRGQEKRALTHRPNRVFELVRAILRWAVGRDLIQIDPTWGLSPPIKKENPRERELSLDEVLVLWTALNRAPDTKRSTQGLPRGARVRADGDIPFTRSIALTLKLSLVTAQRIGEVVGIEVGELNLEGHAPVWTVPSKRSKNGQSNRVPLSPLAIRIIAEAQDLAGKESRWLFPSSSGDGPMHSHAPTKAVNRGRDALGVSNFRVHDLRRTAATRMAELGINPHTISMVLNHVSARRGTITGRVYVHYGYDREKREALEVWSRTLERTLDAVAPALSQT